MKSKKSLILLILFIGISAASQAQYNYDIGLKVSSYQLEQFQLETRFHLKSPYSLLVSLSHGEQTRSNTIRLPVSGDTLFSYFRDFSRKRLQTIKVGMQRKLDFLKSDVFYAGASLGLGYQSHYGWTSSESYTLDSAINYQTQYQEISFSESQFNMPAIKTDVTLSFGADIPLTNRLLVNAELGLTVFYEKLLRSSSSSFSQQGYVSGGIRYSFGKRTVQ